MKYTFRGGTHITEHKNTKDSKIEVMPAPKTLYIPLSQHIGAMCEPIVRVGEMVCLGQVIGEAPGKLATPVHSSVSGKIVNIRAVNSVQGNAIKTVVIENDYKDTLCADIKPCSKQINELTAEEIIDIVYSAGISGMGGATFPTYAKIKSAIGKVDKLIINCAECEPFLTADHRLMLEYPEKITGGAKILLKAFNLPYGYLVIEDNKKDAVKVLEKTIADSNLLKICICKTKYPQGDERQIIYALTGQELPVGKLPSDLGCVVFNVETCAAIYDAFNEGMPLIQRIITVDGDCITNPKNLIVRLGTPYSKVIEYCGGVRAPIYSLISGGPMMGRSRWSTAACVTKGTSALLAFTKEYRKRYEQPKSCIHCGMCIRGCPMHLMPNYLAQYSQSRKFDETEKFDVTSCVECGTCSYNCPAKIPIVQYIRVAKDFLRTKKKN